ncbi:low quality protein: asparagine synthetase domain-containing protein 1-like [Plasmopara halstedii]|uniref:Low quality protein: asparagine synthetase domain-containing protein 1-like n=1 Tax=Plasmopara halstedii TaxID=4781 RepID=A0A0P1AGH6_PLAHL|nr:low quality protein: asparagine synthetase domain-containing protein 1-like [Plasmopara halstedii]CEG39945.1 low quality protein: asparagine synthetase domain-containing protein 1-like [Plasmopara halstedii]|eukprot:XP_024576314.1 low quality protein: asparagine synthetase domain-containing protein 1-like [Plasmopara halstedii]
MHSAVLHLRGHELTCQPIIDTCNNILCWNGEVFGMDEIKDEDKWDPMHDNDTILISEMLQAAAEKLTSEATLRNETSDPVVDVLRRVRGPFAITWFHEATKRIYFAHDRFGRRSLLYNVHGNSMEEKCRVDILANLAGTVTASTKISINDLTRFVLSNVAIGEGSEDLCQYNEVPASGVYVLGLSAYTVTTNGDLPSFRIEFFPYTPIIPTLTVTSSASSHIMDRFGTRLPSITNEAGILAQENLESLYSSACALLVALSNAVGIRIRSLPSRSFEKKSSSAQVAILFSGGIDSVVLAALSHFHTRPNEPIDLLTVCFDEHSAFKSPDRRAAETSHAELCRLYPKRQWNLIKINVSRRELSSAQHEVQTLMAPCDTHMDFNIGAAFWFLSRGCGELSESSKTQSMYSTSASVVLVGIGADEQLAGYGRHRTTLLTKGEEALRAELEMECTRIWKRNLGRDDRCIAAHGREARFPYLDEQVVATIASFSVSSLCDAHLPRGIGEKRALRLVAKALGLSKCANLAKRAIQFGSRIAKVSIKGSVRQTHGNDKFLNFE